MTTQQSETIHQALDKFHIELPSWGFANTGTRFGKFIQAAAATTIEEKFSDAGTGTSLDRSLPHRRPSRAVGSAAGVASAAKSSASPRNTACGPVPSIPISFRIRSTNTARSAIRMPPSAKALDTSSIASRSANALGSRDLSLWFADGSNYPGTQNIRHRKKWLEEESDERRTRACSPASACWWNTNPSSRPSITPTSRIGAWRCCSPKPPGPQAKVLVDTGHHYQAQNIEQIVDWLLDSGMLGGFHFNDRRYADDDLTLGSIDPYQVFRIFHEIRFFEWETGQPADIAYMVDQSHNLKGKIEAMIQTVTTALELYAKAAIVDHEKLAMCQSKCALVDAENLHQGRVFHRCAPSHCRMGQIKRPARKSHGSLPRKRLSGTHHRGALREKRLLSLKLRIAWRTLPACRVHTRVNAWCSEESEHGTQECVRYTFPK